MSVQSRDSATTAIQQTMRRRRLSGDHTEITEQNSEVAVTILKHVESLVERHVEDKPERKQGDTNRT